MLKISFFVKISALAIFINIGLLRPLSAQVMDSPVTVPVQIRVSALVRNDTSGSISLAVTLAGAWADFNGRFGNSAYNTVPLNVNAQLMPGKSYDLGFSALNCVRNTWLVAISVPDGYSIYVDDIKRSRIIYYSYDALPTHVSIRLDDGMSLGAGESTSLRPKRIAWSAGLGSLKTGSPAGAISLRSNGIAAATFDVGSLYCGTGSADVLPIFDSHQKLCQIFADQCLANISSLTGGQEGFVIAFYAREDVAAAQAALSPIDDTLVWVVKPGALPFVEYRFENPTPGAYKKIRITKTSRLNSSSSAPAKIWTTELRNVDGQPVGTELWELIDWTTNTVSGSGNLSPGNSWSRWTYANNGLYETVELLDAANIVATKSRNEYSQYAWGLELVKTIADFGGANVTTSYGYGPMHLGDATYYGKLTRVTRPDGGVVTYTYLDGGTDDFGLPTYVDEPWADRNDFSTFGSQYPMRTEYSYHYASPGYSSAMLNRRIASVRKYVGTVLVSTATMDHTEIPSIETVYYEGTPYARTRMLVQEVRHDYYATNKSLSSTSTMYREDAGMDLMLEPDIYEPMRGYYPGKPFSSIAVDKTQKTWSYKNGIYSNVYHALQTLSNGSGSDWETRTETRGPAGLVNGGSTYESSIRAYDGGLVMQAGGLYFGNAWHNTGAMLFSYLKGILPSDIMADSGESYQNTWPVMSNTWVGGELTSTVNMSGVQRNIEYTASGWKHAEGLVQKGGIPAGTLWTVFGYDGAHHITSRRQQTTDADSSSAEDLVTGQSYDLAGRLSSTLVKGPNGNIGTTIAYDLGQNSTTSTLIPTSGTTTKALYLDGRVKSESGSAVYGDGLSATYTYSADTTGVTLDRLGADGSHSYTLSDWLGRPIRIISPGYNGAGIAQIFTYDPDYGYLQKKEFFAASGSGVSSTRLAPSVLYQYDAMGRVKLECIDVEENGVVGLDRPDRITEYEYNGVTMSQSTAHPVGNVSPLLIYSKIDTYIRPDNGSGSLVRVSTSLKQLNGYATIQDGAYTIYPAASIVRNALSRNDGTDDAATATVTVTKVQPGSATVTTETSYPGVANKAISTSINGFLASDLTAEGVLTTNTYDGYGRLSRKQGRDNVLTDYIYWPGTSAKKNIRTYTMTPSVISSEWKQFSYDGAGRLNRSDRNERGTLVSSYNEYDQRDNLIHVWGSAETPVEYVYDAMSRRTEQHLFRTSGTTIDWTALTWPGGTTFDRTQWGYDATTGLVTSKTSPGASHAITFTYDANNQLKTKTSAEGIVTTYTYYDGSTPADGARGQLKKVEYSVAAGRTPANYVATQPTTYTYYRHGAVATITEGNLKDALNADGVRTFTYRPQDLQVEKETLPNFFGGGVKKLSYSYEDGTTKAGDTSVPGRYSGFKFTTEAQ